MQERRGRENREDGEGWEKEISGRKKGGFGVNPFPLPLVGERKKERKKEKKRKEKKSKEKKRKQKKTKERKLFFHQSFNNKKPIDILYKIPL